MNLIGRLKKRIIPEPPSDSIEYLSYDDIIDGLFTYLSTEELEEILPEPVISYAKSISEETELPFETVLRSKPVRNYSEKYFYDILKIIKKVKEIFGEDVFLRLR